MEKIEKEKKETKKMLATVDRSTYARFKASCAYLEVPMAVAVGQAIERQTKYFDKKVKEIYTRR